MKPFPEHLRSRIFCENTWSPQRHLKPIIKAMQDGITIEFIYQYKDFEEPQYVHTAPVCLKELDKHWYVIGWNPHNEIRIHVYALDRIKTLGEEWTTFSLPQDTDYNKLIESHFHIDKVV
jgi:Predicted transcriptional regulator